MNRQQAKELLPIIQAFIDGKTIQSKLKIKFEGFEDFEDWEVDSNPTFNIHLYEYRIKL